jgi:hypothetical protein
VFDHEEKQDKFFARFFDRWADHQSPMMQYIDFLSKSGAAESIVMACINKGRLDMVKPYPALLDIVHAKAETLLPHLANFESEVINFLLTVVEVDHFVPALSAMMKANAVDSVFKVLQRFLAADCETVKERLAVLNVKDRDGMSVVDYAYLTHHNAVLVYLGEVSAAANCESISMPSVAHLKVTVQSKTEAELAVDVVSIVNHNAFCRLFDDGSTKHWLTFANEDQKSSCQRILEQMKRWGRERTEETFKLIDSGIFEWSVIEDLEGLLAWRDTLERDKLTVLAIDAEFSKADFVEGDLQELEKDQRSVVVSLQVCTDHRVYFIDNLVLKDKQEANKVLRQVFENKEIVKVFHGGHADIVNIFKTFGSSVTNVFDTAKCHAVITRNHSMTRSLASLSKIYLGVALDKTFQRSNWKIRPLPRGMLDYALADSAILMGVYLAMTHDLEESLLLDTARRCNQPLQVEDDNKVDMAVERIELSKSNLRKFKFTFVDK